MISKQIIEFCNLFSNFSLGLFIFILIFTFIKFIINTSMYKNSYKDREIEEKISKGEEVDLSGYKGISNFIKYIIIIISYGIITISIYNIHSNTNDITSSLKFFYINNIFKNRLTIKELFFIFILVAIAGIIRNIISKNQIKSSSAFLYIITVISSLIVLLIPVYIGLTILFFSISELIATCIKILILKKEKRE